MKKPMPVPDADSAAFWRGMRDGASDAPACGVVVAFVEILQTVQPHVAALERREAP